MKPVKSKWVRFTPEYVRSDFVHSVKNTAYHEAGHAFIFAALGVPLLSACVELNFDGEVVLDTDRMRGLGISANKQGTQEDKLSALLIASALFSGVQAEMIFNDELPDGLVTVYGSDNSEAIEYLSECYVGSDIEAAALDAQILARKFLLHYWDAVAGIAAQIEMHGKITGDDLMRLMPDESHDLSGMMRFFRMPKTPRKCTVEMM